MEPAVVILLGAGGGVRLDAGMPKAFIPVGGVPMLTVAARSAAASPSIGALVAAVPPGWEERGAACLAGVETDVTVVAGRSSRQGSVRAALAAIGDEAEIVVVHDVARPFAPPDLFGTVLDVIVDGEDGVVPVVEVTDTVLRTRHEVVIGSELRNELVLAQTPQAFRAGALREAHAKAGSADRVFTDDASLLEWAGFRVRTIPGDPGNLKITTAADLAEAGRRGRSGDG